jgi:uncharacterized membrane protein
LTIIITDRKKSLREVDRSLIKGGQMLFFPAVIAFIFLFFCLLVLVFLLIQIGIIAYAFRSLGISSTYLFFLLLASLIGSYINIPLKRLVQEEISPPGVINFFGFRYLIPETRYRKETIIAINVGGAIVPILLSLYLIITKATYLPFLIATLIVTFIVYQLARPIPGLGIAVPALIPPFLAAVVALIIAPANPPPVAYVSGSIGTLIGADLLNLGRIKELRAPVASIGGAGTFDGIFLTGIMAVILAVL